MVIHLRGNGIAIDVRRNESDHLIVDRVVPARQPKEDELRPIVLVEGQFSFCDISIAGQFRGSARNELDQLVERADSYLSLWKEYNQLERESILQRARQFGWVYYHRQEILFNGERRFHLKQDDNLHEKIQVLSDAGNLFLEANTTPPQALLAPGNDEVVGNAHPTNNKNCRNNRTFHGTCSGLDRHHLTIDLLPPNPDEEFLIPPQGCLFISLQGDATRLARREEAEQLIRTATCEMPQLGLLLENQPVPISRRLQYDPMSKETRKVFENCRRLARKKLCE